MASKSLAGTQTKSTPVTSGVSVMVATTLAGPRNHRPAMHRFTALTGLGSAADGGETHTHRSTMSPLRPPLLALCGLLVIAVPGAAAQAPPQRFGPKTAVTGTAGKRAMTGTYTIQRFQQVSGKT